MLNSTENYYMRVLIRFNVMLKILSKLSCPSRNLNINIYPIILNENFIIYIQRKNLNQ